MDWLEKLEAWAKVGHGVREWSVRNTTYDEYVVTLRVMLGSSHAVYEKDIPSAVTIALQVWEAQYGRD